MGTEAFWNGLFDSRWDDCTFGAEAIRLVYRLRRLGYCEGTRRMYGQMVVHFGHVLAGSERVAAEQINEAVIQKFLREHVPMCRCYRQPPGRRYSYAGGALVSCNVTRRRCARASSLRVHTTVQRSA